MPFQLVNEEGGVYTLPASMQPEQLHVGGSPRIRFVRGYGSGNWFSALDGIREPEALNLVGLLHTDRDEATIQSLLDALTTAAEAAVKLVHVDHDGVPVKELALLGALPVTTEPNGVDGTLLQVTLPLVPGATEWVVATDSGDYDSGYAPGPDPDPGPTAYRHYRINVTANNGRATLNIAELELRETVGGPSIATGGTASASGTFSGSFPPAAAFDGNPSTYWATPNNQQSGWLAYDLGAGNAKGVAQYAVQARADASDGAPKDWTLEGSDDGASWTTLHTVSGQTGWSNGEVRTFTL